MGTYTYLTKVFSTDAKLPVSTVKFKVKVVDKEEKDCITVKVKGTLDVLDRESQAVVTPTLKNLNGTITAVSLGGRNGHLFDAALSQDKTILLSVKNDAAVITNYAYGVRFNLTLENEEGGKIKVMSSEMKVMLKQGRPSVVIAPKQITFASGRYNDCQVVTIQNTLSKTKAATIVNVEQINFNNEFTTVYDPENGTLAITGSGKAVKGRKYGVQYKITYAGQADNVKPTIVTYNVTYR